MIHNTRVYVMFTRHNRRCQALLPDLLSRDNYVILRNRCNEVTPPELSSRDLITCRTVCARACVRVCVCVRASWTCIARRVLHVTLVSVCVRACVHVYCIQCAHARCMHGYIVY